MSKKYNNYQKNFKPTDNIKEETEIEDLKKVKVNCNLLNADSDNIGFSFQASMSL